MGILLIPLVLAAVAGLACAAHQSLRRREVSRVWYYAFFSAMAGGIGAEIYFGFFFRYYAGIIYCKRERYIFLSLGEHDLIR